MAEHTIPYNFDELYRNAQYILGRAGFDVSEGSNTSQLAATMAYMVASLNTNTAFNINETLLPFATKRKNILQDARVLGYEPKHKASYEYKAQFKIDPMYIGFGTLTIPRYSYVEVGKNRFYVWDDKDQELTLNLGTFKLGTEILNPTGIKDSEFHTPNFETIAGTYYYIKYNEVQKTISEAEMKFIYNEAKSQFEKTLKDFEIKVKEGTLVRATDDSKTLKRTLTQVSEDETVTTQYLDIPYTDVEEDGIHCYVDMFEGDNYQNGIEFTRTEDYFFEQNGNENLKHKFLRLDDIEMGTPRVYFQYAGMGLGLPDDAVVSFDILISKGSEGSVTEGASGLLKPPEIELETNTTSQFKNSFGLTISNLEVSLKLSKTGTEDEFNSSIQVNAPKVWNSAHRLITNLDYKSACNRNPLVRDSSVWGGEEEFPRAPGHIWFSFLKEFKNEEAFKESETFNGFERENNTLTKKVNSEDEENERVLFFKKYITGSEIFEGETSILGSLKNRYVPSLTFHHRHPLFLNFDYTINIMKYDLKQNADDLHKTLFEVIKNCFIGNDLSLENFETEYFHSNIVKRIDYSVSDLSGLTCKLETKIMLNEKTLVTENWNRTYKDIYIPLCVPFEQYFDSEGFLDISKLPNIDTEKFLRFSFLNSEPSEKLHPDTEGVEEYELLTGDLFTDWSYILADQERRKGMKANQAQNNSNETKELSDKSAKIFVAPVKIKMQYMFRLKETIPTSLRLGFKLAPDNTRDLSFKNIQVLVYDENDSLGNQKYNQYPETEKDNYPLLQKVFADSEIKSLKEYSRSDISNSEKTRIDRVISRRKSFTENFWYTETDDSNDRTILNIPESEFSEGDIVEVRFERTCGYYYLFNGFEKKILVHLFVNGDYSGFKTAANGMDYPTGDYDVLPDEVAQAWKKHEKEIHDDTPYIDITYSSPRSYLFTSDRRYLTCVEPTGTELEAEKHYMGYNEDGIISEQSKQIRELLKEGKDFDEIREQHPELYEGLPDDAREYEDIEMYYNIRNEDKTVKAEAIEIKNYIDQGMTLEEVEHSHPELFQDLEKVGGLMGHYLTTEGYLDIDDSEDKYSGPKIREYNEAMYLYTPLTTDLFRYNVYLNLKYNSLNFKVRNNVIPRLNKVRFVNATTEHSGNYDN